MQRHHLHLIATTINILLSNLSLPMRMQHLNWKLVHFANWISGLFWFTNKSLQLCYLNLRNGEFVHYYEKWIEQSFGLWNNTTGRWKQRGWLSSERTVAGLIGRETFHALQLAKMVTRILDIQQCGCRSCTNVEAKTKWEWMQTQVNETYEYQDQT